MIPPSSELNPGKRRQMSVKVGFEGSEVSSQKPASVTAHVIFTIAVTKKPVVWQMFELAPCTCNLINYKATLGNQRELTDMSEWQTHDFYDCDSHDLIVSLGKLRNVRKFTSSKKLWCLCTCTPTISEESSACQYFAEHELDYSQYDAHQTADNGHAEQEVVLWETKTTDQVWDSISSLKVQHWLVLDIDYYLLTTGNFSKQQLVQGWMFLKFIFRQR